MKKGFMILCCMAGLLGLSLPGNAATSTSSIRQDARFLSDRMAYELGLSNAQYNDIYEINYDFLSSIQSVMSGVVNGDDYSVDCYYEYLDIRNEDLSYVLTRQQYLQFAGKEYFYRPVYTENNYWRLRIYTVYSNTTYFYFSIPLNFYTYVGRHSRQHYSKGYYIGRYKHELYTGPLRSIRKQGSYSDKRWSDFKVSPRPKQSVSNKKNDNSKNNSRYDSNSNKQNSNSGSNNRYNSGSSKQNSNSSNSSIGTTNRLNRKVDSNKSSSSNNSSSTRVQVHSSSQKSQSGSSVHSTNTQPKVNSSNKTSAVKSTTNTTKSSTKSTATKSTTRKEGNSRR